jgi:hypothetical protein
MSASHAPSRRLPLVSWNAASPVPENGRNGAKEHGSAREGKCFFGVAGFLVSWRFCTI